MKRWIIGIILVLVVLTAVSTAAVLVIIHTDVPQKMIIKALNDELDMNVNASSLRTSFWGNTTITDFNLGLPMENSTLLEIPEIEISHSSIPMTLLSGFTLQSVRILNPVINIRENKNGSWNIQEFAYRIGQNTTGGEQTKFALPKVDVVNASCVVTDNTGRIEKVEPISFKGDSAKQHLWDFDIDIASQILLSGKIAEGGDWSHEINIDIKSLPVPVKNLIGKVPESLALKAGWKGRFRGDALEGQLRLEDVQSGQLQSNGTMNIENSSAGLMISIEDLLIKGLKTPVEQVKLTGGQVKYDGRQIQAQRILAQANQNKASFSGRWNLNDRQGDFNCFWNGKLVERNMSYETTMYGMIDLPVIGNKEVTVSVNTEGKSPWGSWRSEGQISGSGTGPKWAGSQWQVNIPALVWESSDTNIDARDIKAEISTNWPVIRLTGLSADNAELLKAEGEFSAAANNWNIAVDANGLKANDLQKQPVDLKIVAGGNLQSIAVKEFSMTYRDLRLEAAGDLNVHSKELSDTHAKISMVLDVPKDSNDTFENLSGNLTCETEITGTVWPTKLNLQAVLSGDNISLNRKNIEPVKIPWEAQIDVNGVKYNASDFKLFDGTWNLDGRYDFAGRSVELAMNTKQVSLQPVMGLFDLPVECSGMMGTNLDVNLSTDDISQMVISGNWNVKDMVISPIEAQSAEGRIRIQNGIAVFDRIHLKQEGGTANAEAWFRLDQPQFVYVDVDSQKWPLNFSDNNLSLVSDANGTATLNLSKRTIKGKGNLSTSVSVNDKKLADISTELGVEERLLDLNNLKIDGLGGSANGKINIPLDDWTNSKASVDWNDINISEFASYWPDFNGLDGKSSGSLIASPADEKRAFEPLQININGKLYEGSYHYAGVGEYDVSAYLGRDRLLIDKAEIKAMNGTIKYSGSISKRKEGLSTYVNVDFSQIELNQLEHLLFRNAKLVLGEVSGKGMLVIVSDLHGLTGEVNIQLDKSDLAHTVIVGSLYNTMKLKFGNKEPKGQGQISLRFEGSSLQIPSFYYFNRGVEIRGSGTIEDLTKGGASPVKGYAVGSARPLKGISLLGINELDQLMASLQTNVSSVKIEGTLGDPKVVPVPFQEISSGLRALLWNQLHK